MTLSDHIQQSLEQRYLGRTVPIDPIGPPFVVRSVTFDPCDENGQAGLRLDGMPDRDASFWISLVGELPIPIVTPVSETVTTIMQPLDQTPPS